VQRFCQTAWMSQNQSKPCSEVLRGLEVVKTNDIAQALNQTIQVQPFEALLGIQLHNVWGLSSIRDDPRPSRSPLWRSLASGKHTLTAAATTPETFDECRDWRAGREARTRQCLRTKKADVPALKALDCYTKLSTHEQTTCSDRIFDGGPHLSDIKSIRRYNRRNRHPRCPAFRPLSPGLTGRGFLFVPRRSPTLLTYAARA
jgi:hypothetical protein